MATLWPSLKGRDVQEVFPSEDQPLYHMSIDSAASNETILFLHGLTGSSREWLDIAPNFARSYHLLLPDLPGHSRSKAAGPFDLSATVDHLANLIRSNARDSVCHIVGFSLGGYIALSLAEKHPHLIQDAFVSGVNDITTSRHVSLVKFAPYIDVPLTKLLSLAPRSTLTSIMGWMGLTLPKGFAEDRSKNTTVKLIQDGFAAIFEYGPGRPVAARTCLIAASKHDDVQGTKALCQVLKSGEGAQTHRAFVLKGMMHTWGLQRPTLFAGAVQAWIGNKELPAAFERLE